MHINANTLFNNKTEIVSQRIKALPPAVQTSQEIIAILRDERLFEKLGYKKIEGIVRLEDGYEIQTEDTTLRVHVNYLPKDFCLGPAQFELLFDEPISNGHVGLKALPPAVQSSREIIAILSDERLYQLLGNSEQIERIVKTEDGYKINTEHYTLQVHVRYVPNECCGPAKFVLEFDDPIKQVVNLTLGQ
jgi:hypothetical protein